MRWLPLLLILLTLSACAVPAHPRSPRIVDPGAVGWELQIALGEAGPSTVEGEIEGRRRIRSDAGSVGIFDGGALPTFPYWWDGAARVGLGSGCELGTQLSLALRLAPELRCGFEVGPFAAAASGASGFTFGFGRAGPWWRGGLDLGLMTPFGEALVGVYVTRARESHRLQLAEDAASLLIIDLPEDIAYDGEAIPAPQVARDETRLTVPIGWSFPGPVHFVLGVTPFWILDAGPPSLARCAGCRPFVLHDYEQSWGVALSLGVQR